jgi:hypothetical protein
MFKSNIHIGAGFFRGAGFVKGAGLINRFYGTKRLTRDERNSFSIPPELHEIIIGNILGDTHIERKFITRNAMFRFEQGLVHEAYFIHLYDKYKDYCNSPLKYSARKPDFRTGQVYTRIQFQTFSLPCLNYYHELFYVNGVKIVPLNIGEPLTPISLAYWAMDDGSKMGSGFIFCTDSNSLCEVELLVKVLKDKFNLFISIHIGGNSKNHRIYIKANDMAQFRSLVTPHFHPSMSYKLSV